MSKEITYNPIGIFKSKAVYPYEVPRQSTLAKNQGQIELYSNIPLESLYEISSFEYIWLIYDLHKNKNWNPLVATPRAVEKKGVFATRSPYRPNSIGLSAVKLKNMIEHVIYIENHDLLNETPILDIKPYVTYSDQLKTEHNGWLKPIEFFEIKYSTNAEKKINWLNENTDLAFVEFIQAQLTTDPFNTKRKRIKQQEEENLFHLHYRTWVIRYKKTEKKILIKDILSNYTKKEMCSLLPDKYKDKKVHLSFNSTFTD